MTAKTRHLSSLSELLAQTAKRHAARSPRELGRASSLHSGEGKGGPTISTTSQARGGQKQTIGEERDQNVGWGQYHIKGWYSSSVW